MLLLRSCNTFLFTQFILAEVHVTVGRHDIECCTVVGGELKHIVCRVPSCGHITGHDAWLESLCFEDAVPLGKNNCGGIFDSLGDTTKLLNRESMTFVDLLTHVYIC